MSNGNNIHLNFKSSIGNLGSTFKKFSTGMAGMGASASNATGKFAKFYKETRKLNNSFTNITKDANRASKSFFNMGNALRGISLYALGNQMAKAIQSSMDMIETANLFEVSMGSMAEATDRALNSISELTGLDQTNMRNAVGTYALLARSMGMTSEQSKILSTNTYQLGMDLSSLMNVPVAQAMGDLRAGLVGQSETVYKYGIDVTEASLKAEAMRQGIEKSVRNMGQGEKMALRYAVMIRQTALAQGDFARTINQPANQLKILGERVTTMTRALGSLFIPMLQTVLPYLNAIVKVITRIIQALAMLFGYEAPSISSGGGVGGGISGIEDGADDATGAVGGTTKALKELKKATLGFDELNIMPEPTSPSSGGGAGSGVGIGGIGDFELPTYDAMFGDIKQDSDAIVEQIENMIDRFVELSQPLINANFDPLKESLDGLWTSLGKFGGSIGDGLSKFYSELLVPLGVWAIEDVLPFIVEQFGKLIDVFTKGNEMLLGTNLEPLVTAFDTLWEAIKPYTETIGAGLEYFYLNVLIPMGIWVLEAGIPTMFNLLADAINWLNDTVKGSTFLKDFVDKTLIPFGTWINKNKEVVIGGIMGIAGAFAVYNGVMKTLGLLSKLTALFSPLTLIVASLALVAGAFKYAYDNSEPFRKIVDTIAKFLKDELVREFELVKSIVTYVWQSVFVPFGSFLKVLWTSVLQPIAKFIADVFGIAFKTFGGMAEHSYKNILVPMGKFLTDVFAKAIESVITIINHWMPVVEGIMKLLLGLWDVVLKPIAEYLAGAFTKVWGDITQTMGDKIEAWRKILTGLMDFITGVFTGNWGKAWDGIKTMFKGAFEALPNLIKVPLNSIIRFVNKVINGINKFKIDIPDWVADLAGVRRGSFGINISKIPELARGGSLSGGQLFEAGEFGKAELIGSHQGKTTVMPLENTSFVSAIHDAVKSAIASGNGGMGASGDHSLELILQVGNTEFGRVVVDSINKLTKQEGRLSLDIK